MSTTEEAMTARMRAIKQIDREVGNVHVIGESGTNVLRLTRWQMIHLILIMWASGLLLGFVVTFLLMVKH